MATKRTNKTEKESDRNHSVQAVDSYHSFGVQKFAFALKRETIVVKKGNTQPNKNKLSPLNKRLRWLKSYRS